MDSHSMAGSFHALNDRRLRRFARLLPLLAALAGLAALLPASSTAARSFSIKDPSGIACPQPPSGWTNPVDGGRTILSPLTDSNVAGNTVNVSCDYFTAAGKHLLVDLLYALPSDPNPHNDFYFGCTSGGTNWSDADRMYRVTSKNQWAIAAFYDSLGQIGGNEVTAFQNVTRQLLQNGEGYAHGCSLLLEPTPVRSQLQFSFQVSAGNASGSFFTEGMAGAKSLPVVAVGAPDIKLNVKSHGARHPLTIQVRSGVSFVPGKAATGRQVKLAVVVKSSRVPSCPRGSTGTLTITTAPSVLLKVCSQSFLQGSAKATIVSVG
jgi:hypothetical protein